MFSNNLLLIPPLRVVITKECNGVCSFCHNEGNNSDINFITQDVILQCITAAKELSLPRISLTGGEPTLHADIYDIIRKIKADLPDVELGITTTGINISKLLEVSGREIDKINVSVSSLKEEVYMRATRVNPIAVFKELKGFSGKSSVNIVVTNDNFSEIEDILETCFEHDISVDLMPILNSSELNYVSDLMSKLTQKYEFNFVSITSTPTLYREIKDNVILRIKHPAFSGMLNRVPCRNCEYIHKCDEKMSAVRVYPDGTVTPCINSKLSKRGINNLKDNIIDIYNDYISNDVFGLLTKL